jgi:hypothetical protein
MFYFKVLLLPKALCAPHFVVVVVYFNPYYVVFSRRQRYRHSRSLRPKRRPLRRPTAYWARRTFSSPRSKSRPSRPHDLPHSSRQPPSNSSASVTDRE